MDLTTLTRAKAMLAGGVGTLPADPYLQALIAAASDAAQNFCSRVFQRNVVSNLYLNGTGTARQMAPQNPIVSVTGPIVVNGYSFAAAPSMTASGISFTDTGQQGYGYDRKFFYMFGGAIFSKGFQNVLIPSLTTGYTTKEINTIPATPYILIPRQGASVDAWGSPMSTSGYAFADRGVIFTLSGVALVSIASGTPTTGQYLFSGGSYLFAVADATKQVTMSYDFVPASVELAVIETMGTKIRQAANFGIRSRSIANENVTYSDVALSKSAMALLQPYRWVVAP